MNPEAETGEKRHNGAERCLSTRSRINKKRKWDALGRKPEPKPEAWLKEKAEERQRRRIADLERLVARQALELDFFKGALLRIGENRRKRGSNSGRPSTSKSGTWTGSKAN